MASFANFKPVYAHHDLQKGMMLCHQTMMVPRRVYEEVGKYNCEFLVAADYEWVIRAQLKGIKFHKANLMACYFRQSGLSHQRAWQTMREVATIGLRYYGQMEAIQLTLTMGAWAVKNKMRILFPKAVISDVSNG